MSSELSGMNATANLLPTTVSRFAQDSLREIKRLRILLTKLLIPFDDATDENRFGDPDKGSISAAVEEDEAKDSKMSPSGDEFGSSGSKTHTSSESFLMTKLVNQIGSSLDTLDHLAKRMHTTCLGSRKGELGLCNALSMFTAMDQLDFAKPAVNEFGEVCETDVNETRRVDWLIDRADAERWSNRYWERTHTILEGLLVCSAFRRSHMASSMKRNRSDFMDMRDVGPDLETLLNDLHHSCPRLTIAVVHTGFNVTVAHVRVGDVMQCFVTFRRLHPERIIVRGLNECMMNQSIDSSQSNSSEMHSDSLSQPLEELVNSNSDLPVGTKEMIASLLSFPQHSVIDRATSASDQPAMSRGRRGGMSGGVRPIVRNQFPLNQLDLITPSELHLFQRISCLAQSALLHYSKDHIPPSAVRGLFLWLHSYHDLFVAPCGRCGNLLGHDISLPLWRNYLHLRKEDSRVFEPHHEHCQAMN